MPNFDTYMMHSTPIDDSARAVDAWNRIQADPSTITVQGGTAQVVRIEHESTPSDENTNAGESDMLRCTVFGVIGHPVVANTALVAGDRFALDGFIYIVQRVIKPPGEVQAFCESV